jgi:hypothetical protein
MWATCRLPRYTAFVLSFQVGAKFVLASLGLELALGLLAVRFSHVLSSYGLLLSVAVSLATEPGCSTPNWL